MNLSSLTPKIEQARKSNYSDFQIASYLINKGFAKSDVESLMKSVPKTDVVSQLAQGGKQNLETIKGIPSQVSQAASQFAQNRLQQTPAQNFIAGFTSLPRLGINLAKTVAGDVADIASGTVKEGALAAKGTYSMLTKGELPEGFAEQSQEAQKKIVGGLSGVASFTPNIPAQIAAGVGRGYEQSIGSKTPIADITAGTLGGVELGAGIAGVNKLLRAKQPIEVKAPTAEVTQPIEVKAPKLSALNKPTQNLITKAKPIDSEAFKKMVVLARENSATMSPSKLPKEVAGQTFIEKFSQLESLRKKFGGQKTGVVNKMKQEPINVTSQVLKLKEDIANSPFKDSADAQRLTKYIDGINLSVDEGRYLLTPKLLDDVRRKFFDVLKLGKNKNTLDSTIINAGQELRDSFDTLLSGIDSNYSKLNAQFAPLKKLSDDVKKALGVNQFDDVADFNLKAGEILGRLKGNASADVESLVKALDQAAQRYNIKNTGNLQKQVTFSDLLEDIYGITQTKSFKGEIARGIDASKAANLAQEAIGTAVDVKTANVPSLLNRVKRLTGTDVKVKQQQALEKYFGLIKNQTKSSQSFTKSLNSLTKKKEANLKAPKIEKPLDASKYMQEGAVGQEVSPLMQEAKKYKSAEEFVSKIETGNDPDKWVNELGNKTGSPVVLKSYHGTDADFDKFLIPENGVRYSGDGVYFTPSKEAANHFGKNVKEVYLDLKNPFVKYLHEGNIDQQFNELAKEIKNKGYDSIIVRIRDTDLKTGELVADSINEIVVFDTNAIKNKSQLTDIWKKAHGK